MEAKELRIGNLVEYEDDESIFKVTSIEKSGLGVENESESVIWIDIDKFDPISMTEEWLLKFGFKINDEGRHKTVSNNEVKFYITYFNEVLFMDLLNRNIHIKYIHQLQNIYFAVTGEELEIRNGKDLKIYKDGNLIYNATESKLDIKKNT